MAIYLLDIGSNMDEKGKGMVINLEGNDYVLKSDDPEYHGECCDNCDLRNYKGDDSCAEDPAHPDFRKMVAAIEKAGAHECNNQLIWKRIIIKHDRKKLKITPRLQTPS